METLRLFCDVVATKNFTRAAEWNDRTQTHASNLFLALEHAFGARLAERHHGFFQLTPAGELCHRHFLEILRLYDTLEPQMQAARKAAADTIELAACYSIGLHQLPPCLERFRRDFPTADVRVRYSLTACMTRCWIARSTSAWCVIPGGGPAWP
jgi:LysR family transcriptional regulator, transcriptional activator of the cysJI operon